MYVLDSDVISRTSPLSREGNRVGEWLLRHRGRTFVSAVTLAEMHFGADRLRLRGATRQAQVIAAWIEGITIAFRDSVIDLDLVIGRRAGEMLARADRAGFDPGFVDACIAATADVRGYEVVTFNARHFAAFDVPYRAPSPSRGSS